MNDYQYKYYLRAILFFAMGYSFAYVIIAGMILILTGGAI